MDFIFTFTLIFNEICASFIGNENAMLVIRLLAYTKSL